MMRPKGLRGRNEASSMGRTAFFILASACLFLHAPAALAAEEAAPAQGEKINVAILDFNYVDTSGESANSAQEHRARLDALAAGLRSDFVGSGRYRIVTPVCRPEPCVVGSTSLDELTRAAKDAGAKLLIMGAVHKESTLIQWAKVLAINVDDQRVVLDKLITFRGDSDEAWTRAEAFMARELVAAGSSQGAADSKPPVKLALFDFELLDVSGGAGVIPEDARDAEQLRLATEAARKLIAQSGHYALVDVSGADSKPASAHDLHDCGGCDAALAAKLGADQSLVGVVTRVTRTDYNVTYTLRDARSGKVLAVQQTDLRIGANYSWPRGAASLIRDKFLAQ